MAAKSGRKKAVKARASKSSTARPDKKKGGNSPTNVVVVESPAKARTIERFLGKNFVVKASQGHVRDLPKGSLGVDIEAGFEPSYSVIGDKRNVVGELKKLGDSASSIYLATDPDREGEAISWHLVKAAAWDKGKVPVRRVVFHEITREAVEEAFRDTRDIDMELVNAQQARRILDRLVGYQISPLLWRKVQRGLSAGRVQSVALRMIVDREKEIEAFVPKEYWTLDALLRKLGVAKAKKGETFTATLHSRKGEKGRLNVPDESTARRVEGELQGADYNVAEVKKREVRQSPSPPFITSTLQQEAWRKLRFSSKRTMVAAQQLYEGLPTGDEGSMGLITYMRTDSTHVAPSALNDTREYIQKKFGKEYLPAQPRYFRKKAKGAQEAHEAIRPTSIRREPLGSNPTSPRTSTSCTTSSGVACWPARWPKRDRTPPRWTPKPGAGVTRCTSSGPWVRCSSSPASAPSTWRAGTTAKKRARAPSRSSPSARTSTARSWMPNSTLPSRHPVTRKPA